MKHTDFSYPGIKAQFITDAHGKRKQIILDIEQFEELLETLEDYQDIALAAVKRNKQEKVKSLSAIKKQLLKDND